MFLPRKLGYPGYRAVVSVSDRPLINTLYRFVSLRVVSYISAISPLQVGCIMVLLVGSLGVGLPGCDFLTSNP